MTTTKTDIAYLGPRGSFSDIVSRDRFGDEGDYIPLPSIDHIFDYVESHEISQGIVPIENSAAGIIHPTVDRLLDAAGQLWIQEELSVRVRLAYAGLASAKDKPLRVYSHFAPFHHCDTWLKSHHPMIERIEVASTSEAARKAANDPEGTALCTRQAANLYELDIFEYPVQQKEENITQFYRIGGSPRTADSNTVKTSLKMMLPNTPGALVTFLDPFRVNNINLTRILSRPMQGRPQEYVFLIDLVGQHNDQSVQLALNAVEEQELCLELTPLGSYSIANEVAS